MWSEWINIQEIDNYNQYVPQIAVDSQGTLYAVWSGRDAQSANTQIKFSKSTDSGATWSAWENIQEISGRTQSNPSICIDNNDNIHVAWDGHDDTFTSKTQIKYTKSTDGGNTWSAWENIQEVADYNQRYSKIISDDDDNLHVVWEGYDSLGASKQIKYSGFVSGDWTPWVNISSDLYSYEQITPEISLNSDNDLVVMWTGLDSQSIRRRIKFSKSTDGGSNWSAWINVTTNDYNHYSPTFSIDSNNTIHMVCYDTSDYRIEYYKSTDGGDTWTSLVRVDPDESWQGLQWMPSISVNNGVIHVVWEGWGEYMAPAIIKYITSLDGGATWTSSEDLITPEEYDQSTPRIITDLNGGVYVVWAGMDVDNGYTQIKYIFVPPSTPVVPKKCTIKVRINSVWRKA